MGNQHYTEKDILDKSRELIHAFMNRQLLPFQDLLDLGRGLCFTVHPREG